MKQQQNDTVIDNHVVEGLFPIPLYRAHRYSNLDPTEEADIEDVIKAGSLINKEAASNNTFSLNKYVFETKLVNLKEFCEKHIKIYVKEVLGIIEKEEVAFHITQSWLNITKPGENHAPHWYPNSIISGVFYISIKEDDQISFYDPYYKSKQMIQIERTHYQNWNSDVYNINVNNNELILFPSWLEHGIAPNENTTMNTDRISLAFNVFVRGNIGIQGSLNELVLR